VTQFNQRRAATVTGPSKGGGEIFGLVTRFRMGTKPSAIFEQNPDFQGRARNALRVGRVFLVHAGSVPLDRHY